MLLIAPFAKMVDDFSEVFSRHNSISTKAEYEVEQYSLDAFVEPDPDNIRDVELDAEVVITRGLISTALRRKNFYVPVVEVPVAANDLIRAFHRARLVCPGETIAVTGAPNMVMGAEDVADILGIPIKVYVVETQVDIEAVAEQVASDGLKILIGGIHTTECAEKRGIRTILMESGKESIWHAITEAKRLAYLVRREEEKAERLSAVLNHAEEGFVVFDPNGRIQVFNKAAERLFALPARKALGAHIGAVFPEYAQLRDERAEGAAAAGTGLSEVVKSDRFALSVFSAKMTRKGEPTGFLLTMQDISKIVQLETRIRERMHQHGHVAKHSFSDIIGSSAALRSAVATALHYAQTDSTVMIIGKTGTGKEMFAQSIHNASPRRAGPFVAVNCAALPAALLESELFGYAEGAFTGAAKGGKAGLFELAHRGTLFLDEISEIDMSLQSKLLRALQEKEIRRVGHDKNVPVDVRIVVATNRDLSALVRSGQFREDLFYRLNVLELPLPELKDRRDDVPLLIKRCMDQLERSSRGKAPEFSDAAMAALRNYDWPGNVRQLRNICERLYVLHAGGRVDADDSRRVLGSSAAESVRSEPHAARPEGFPTLLAVEKKASDCERILTALRANGFHKGKAAESLGISRVSLWRKMKELDL